MISLFPAAVALFMGVPVYAGILADCENIQVRSPGPVLYAECPDQFGTMVASTAFVSNWVDRNAATRQLQWSVKPAGSDYNYDDGIGYDFRTHCDDCSINAQTLVMSCLCLRPGWSYINLDEHFINSNGTIKCDARGPVTPAPWKNIPFPADMRVSAGTYDDNACSTTTNPFGPIGPGIYPDGHCNNLEFYVDFPALSAKMPHNPHGVWQMELFSGKNCKGTSLAKVRPASGNTCVKWSSTPALSFGLRALWNTI